MFRRKKNKKKLNVDKVEKQKILIPSSFVKMNDSPILRLPSQDITNEFFTRGRECQKKGDYKQAVECFTIAIDGDKDGINRLSSVYYFQRGFSYNKLQQNQKALDDFTKAIQLYDNDAVYFTERGHLYYKMKMYDKAIEDYLKGLQIQPSSTVLHNSLGSAYSKTRNFSKANEHYSQARVIRFSESVAETTKNIQNSPKNAKLYLIRARSHRNLKNQSKALEDLTKAIEINPTDACFFYDRCIVYEEMRSYSKAIDDITKAIVLDSKNAEYYHKRGELFRNLMQFEYAAADFTKAVELDKFSSNSLHERGIIYFKMKKYDLAIKDFNQAISIDNSSYSNGLLSNVYFELRDFDKALEFANKAIELNSAYQRPYYVRGCIHQQKKNFKSAIEDFQVFLELTKIGQYKEMFSSEIKEVSERLEACKSELSVSNTKLSSPINPRVLDSIDVDNLSDWLDRLKLGHLLPTLQNVGVYRTDSLRYLDELDLENAAIKPVEKRKLFANIQMMKSEIPPTGSAKFPWELESSFLQNSGWISHEGIYKSNKIIMDGNIVSDAGNVGAYIQDLFKSFFQGEKYKLVKAYAVHNPNLQSAFENRLVTMKRRLDLEADLFAKKGYSDNTEWRQWVLNEIKARASKFPHNENSGIVSLPVLQGLRDPSVAFKICQTGLAKLSIVDDGYYGTGMYFTTSSEYAIDLYARPDKEGLYVLLVCWIILGNPFPCVEYPDKKSPLRGKPLKSPHDSHVAVVAKTGVPVQPNTIDRNFDEYIIDQESQVLPAFVLFVQK